MLFVVLGAATVDGSGRDKLMWLVSVSDLTDYPKGGRRRLMVVHALYSWYSLSDVPWLSVCLGASYCAITLALMAQQCLPELGLCKGCSRAAVLCRRQRQPACHSMRQLLKAGPTGSGSSSWLS